MSWSDHLDWTTPAGKVLRRAGYELDSPARDYKADLRQLGES